MSRTTTTSPKLSFRVPWRVGNASLLVSWCFEPSQPQRITPGLNTNFILIPSYSFRKSQYQKSCFFKAYFYSAATQHGNLHPAGGPILFCGPTQEPCVSHSQHRKNLERFWKNAVEWTGRVEMSKEENPGSKRSMYAVVGRGNAELTTSKSGHRCRCQNCSQRPPVEKTGKGISAESSLLSPRRQNRSSD